MQKILNLPHPKSSFFSFVRSVISAKTKQKPKMEMEWEEVTDDKDCIFNKLNSFLNLHFWSKNKVSNIVFQNKVPTFRNSQCLHILKKKVIRRT